MKYLILILSSVFSLQAFSYEIPPIADIEWTCEEGVGNLENPEVLIKISGKFETAVSREFTLVEKQQMQVIIYEDGAAIHLAPENYKMIWENEDGFQALNIEFGDSQYRVSTTTGNALILKITRPGRFWGKKVQIGSC